MFLGFHNLFMKLYTSQENVSRFSEFIYEIIYFTRECFQLSDRQSDLKKKISQSQNKV